MSTTKTASLVVSLIDKLTAPAKGIAGTIDRMTAASRKNAAQMSAMRGQMMDAVGAGYALYRGLSAPINAAVDYESALADVRKVVDFESPAAFKQMGKDIRALSLEMPMAADGIAQLVAAAGQSGFANDELLPFAEMAAKVGVAWEMSAEQTGTALAKLKAGLGLTVEETGSLADALNHLGNNSAAAAPDILAFTMRGAPLAKQFGLSAEQASAFGAAMIGAGFNAEMAGTSFQNMGLALTRGASATGRQTGAFKKLGLDSKKVAKAMQQDAVGTITDVFARLRELPDHVRGSVMSDLFGNEAKALAPLINNSELLAHAIGLVGDKSKYAGSANAEYAERANTTGNALQLFKNRVTDLNISIGDALIPGLNSLIDTVGPIVTSFSEMAQRFPQVTNAVVGVSAAVVGFRVAATAAQYAGLFIKGAFLDAGVAALSAARSIGKLAFAPVIAGFNGLRTAVIGYTASAAILGHGGAMKIAASSMLGMLNPLRLVTAAMHGLKYAIIGTGIGAAIVGLAAAGTWIYQNWSNLSSMFKGFGDAFMLAISPIRPAIDPVIDGISSLISWVGNLLGPVEGAEQAFGSFGVAAGRAVGQAVMAVVELPSKIVAMASEIYEAAKRLGKAIYDGISEMIAELVSYIKSSISGALSSAASGARNLASRLSFGLIGGSGSEIDGARADGGPVRAGGTYLVGERGPELFTPKQSGMVHPNDVYRTARGSEGLSAGTSSAGNNVSVTNNITVYSQANEGADSIARKIAGRIQDTLAGGFQDGAYA